MKNARGKTMNRPKSTKPAQQVTVTVDAENFNNALTSIVGMFHELKEMFERMSKTLQRIEEKAHPPGPDDLMDDDLDDDEEVGEEPECRLVIAAYTKKRQEDKVKFLSGMVSNPFKSVQDDYSAPMWSLNPEEAYTVGGEDFRRMKNVLEEMDKLCHEDEDAAEDRWYYNLNEKVYDPPEVKRIYKTKSGKWRLAECLDEDDK